MKFNEWLSKRNLLEGKRTRTNDIVCQRCGHEEEKPFNNHQFDRGEYRCPKCGGPFDFKVHPKKHPGGMPDPSFHGRRIYKWI